MIILMDLMLDIETLGLRPMSVITQVAAVPFELNDTNLSFGMNFNINLKSCLDNGGIIDASTLLWTAENNLKSIKNSGNEYYIYDALNKLDEFFHEVRPVNVWAKSPQFDCVILESWYNHYNLPIPWKYNQLMDVRTINYVGKELFGLGEEMEVIHNRYKDKLHDPIQDCFFQIEVLRNIINYPVPKQIVVDENEGRQIVES